METTRNHSTSSDRNGADAPGRPLDVVVIGGGQAGLSMAWYLAKRGVRHLVIDANQEVGTSWRKRWDSLRLFSPAQYDALPGSTFPAQADTYPSKDDVADYLARYAEANALPVLAGTTVTRVSRRNDHFDIHTSQGTIRARQVVVATGAFGKPRVPSFANELTGVAHLHSSQYQRPSDLPAGTVLVVGAANSGLQIAADLAASHEVVVAVGTRPPAVRQRIAGRDLFWWLTTLGLMNRGANSQIARRMRARGDLVVGTRMSDLEDRGVQFRKRLIGATGATARFADGTEYRPDAVIWATGFQPDYGWIDIPDVVDDAGQPRHDQGRSRAIEGLWFLGLPWQRTRGSSLLGFVQRDAEYLDQQIFAASQHSPKRNPKRNKEKKS